MLVANSFDLWQKDAFFSAAEEVQNSADIMESAYRTWLRAKGEGLIPQHLNELERELQMALGTAKWQLEEFEKAVRLSYRKHGDDITITRHRQFVSVIEEQITRVETALKESFNMDGKKPFRWVNLDEEECHDLALFLSGSSGTSLTALSDDSKLEASTTSSSSKNTNGKDHSSPSGVTSKTQISDRGNSLEVDESANCFIEVEEKQFREDGDGISSEADKSTSNRRIWNSHDRSTLEIVIDSGNMQMNKLIEVTPKDKVKKPFSRARGVLSNTQLKITSLLNQPSRGSPRCQRQQQTSLMLPVQSMRFILVVMLTIFLVVPFLLYSPLKVHMT